MAWKCPECRENNHDDMEKCYCGYDLVQAGRKRTANADPETSKKTGSETPSKSRRTDTGMTDITGQTLLQRRSLVQQWFWVSGGAIAAGLILIAIVLMSDEASASPMIFTFPGVGIILLVQTIMRSKKPMVVVHRDHVEIDQTKLHLVRYSDLQKVERPNQRRLDLIAKTDVGETKKITIALDMLEQDQGEQLALFLSGKAGVCE